MKNNLIKYTLVLFIFSLFFVSNIFAQDNGDTTSPAAFLNIPLGTRTIGMGGTFVAIADDASTLFLNPAGLVRLDFTCLSIHTGTLFDGTYSGYISFIIPPGESDVLGFGFGVMGYTASDNVENYDSSGNLIGLVQNYCIAPYLAIGIKQGLLDTNDSIGFSLKGIFTNLNGVKGYGIGVDFGILSNVIIDFGVTIKDLITIIKYDNRSYFEFLSPRAVIGLSHKGLDDGEVIMVISLEIDKPLLNNDCFGSIGGYFRVWKYEKPININDISIEDIAEMSEFPTALYILAGYDFKTFNFGLSFTFSPINLRIDIASKFPTVQDENFSLYFNIDFHF